MATRNVPNDSLEKIATEVIGCPFVNSHEAEKMRDPGEGQLSAKLMFIGEAPVKMKMMRESRL